MAFQGLSDNDDDILADINVTPLVDVMLVLLIIFMIAAPMLHQGIEVNLPQAQAQNLPMRVEDPLILSIRQDGALYVREDAVERDDLVDRLKGELSSRPQETVFLKADRDVPYGQVIDILDVLQRGGIVHVGMVTERPPRGARR